MDINAMLAGVKCTCGRVHTCAIEKVYIERGAISHLRELCAEESGILLVADGNTYAAAGRQVEEALAGKSYTSVIFPGESILIPNEAAIERVEAALSGIGLIIGIGSGVIQDLCKYVSHTSKIPYMVVATAPSMDGYASTGAAMILGGMKVTVAAGVPRAFLADTEVLRKAPIEMIKAGYGDIIGKYSALCDWRLAAAVNGEYLCEYIYGTTYAMIEKTKKNARGLLERREESVAALTEALIIVGIMMSFAGSSRPASGSEHHLSHFFEIVGIVRDEPYFPHGIDVAYSTVVTAGLRKALLARPFAAAQYAEPRAEYVAAMERVYGAEVGAGCVALQDKVGTYGRDRVSVYRQKEMEIRKILENTPGPEEILELLSLCELDMAEFYSLYGEEKIAEAVRYAKDLKDRYSVLWMNYDMQEN